MTQIWSIDTLDSDDGSLGPATDLVVSVLAVLLLILFTARATLNRVEAFDANLRELRAQQVDFVQALASAYGSEALVEGAASQFATIPIGNNSQISATAQNHVQTFSFGGSILFDLNATILREEGVETMKKFSDVLTPRLEFIEEIRINGHADSSGTISYNLDLAGERAKNVYQYLVEQGIDPNEEVMSASTFGQFMPVDRKGLDVYDAESLKLANSSESLRQRNRRIEVVIFYN